MGLAELSTLIRTRISHSVMVTIEVDYPARSESIAHFILATSNPVNVLLVIDESSASVEKIIQLKSSISQLPEQRRVDVRLGFSGLKASARDLDVLQHLVLGTADALSVASLELSGPSLRVELIDTLHGMQCTPFLLVYGAEASLSYPRIQSMCDKYGRSAEEVLVKVLLQLGSVVVLPLSMVLRCPSLIQLSHPFTERKMFVSPTREYRFVIDADDVAEMLASSEIHERGMYANDSFALMPTPRKLTFNRSES